jgi:hypothetical protein
MNHDEAMGWTSEESGFDKSREFFSSTALIESRDTLGPMQAVAPREQGLKQPCPEAELTLTCELMARG